MLYGTIHHMKAKEIFYRKIANSDGSITEMIIWQLPHKSEERPHGFKYRLYHGDKNGNCLVRYDNEAGKGDHKHIRKTEFHYEFSTVENLMKDFFSDISQVSVE